MELEDKFILEKVLNKDDDINPLLLLSPRDKDTLIDLSKFANESKGTLPETRDFIYSSAIPIREHSRISSNYSFKKKDSEYKKGEIFFSV